MITTGNWQDALEPVAISNFQLGLREIPSERDMLFDVRTSRKMKETYLELGDIGMMEAFTGDLNYEDVSQGNKMEIELTQFAKGMKIERIFVETDQLDVVRDLPRMLGLATRRRISSDCYAIFNNAFTTDLKTIDALALCSTVHANHANHTGTTQSNKGTTALSASSLETARQAMRDFMSNADELIEVKPDLLVVGRGNEEAAWEIINTSGKVDTANNNANFHKGRYKLLVSDWLDDSNDWFLIDSELMKMFNVWNNVVPLEFGQATEFDGFAAKYSAYMAYGRGSRDWRWVYGNQVS